MMGFFYKKQHNRIEFVDQTCLVASNKLFWMVRAAERAPSISLEPPAPPKAPVPAYILLSSLPEDQGRDDNIFYIARR